MKLVVDASVLFATIISKGKDLEGRVLDIFFHEKRITTASSFSKTEFDAFLAVLSLRIKIVPQAEIEKFLPKARNISPDPDDAPYIAAAFASNCSVWSDDPHFKKQFEVKVYSTRDLSKLLFA